MLGSRQVTEKRLYYDPDKETVIGPGGGSHSSLDRVSLDMSGFTLVDCPTRNAKETLDKKILVDIMSFAYERICDKKVRHREVRSRGQTHSLFKVAFMF